MRQLVLQTLLPEKPFLEGYYGSIILCWEALGEVIKEDRRKLSHYWVHFEDLYNRAKRYEKKQEKRKKSRTKT